MKTTVTIKENRIFRRLYCSNKNYVCPYFVLYCRENPLGYNRLGITTGTKLGGAVVRNRARRRLKEMYRINEETVRRSLDIVIVARSRGIEAPFALICAEFLKSLEALDIRAS